MCSKLPENFPPTFCLLDFLNDHWCPCFSINDWQNWKNSSKIYSLSKKKKSQYGSSFCPQLLATPLPLEEKLAKEVSRPRFTSCNQTEWDYWCCVNRDELLSAAACWPDSRGLSSPPPPAPFQSCGEACLALWNNGTKRPRRSSRNLFDRDCCCNEF